MSAVPSFIVPSRHSTPRSDAGMGATCPTFGPASCPASAPTPGPGPRPCGCSLPSPGPLWALVDCNNFYASCERLFRPDLRGKPIVVLSNNDGCIISRSDEAKALGVEMGAPAFKVRR